MKWFSILILFLFFASPCAAGQSERYLDNGKVIFEEPQESDVLKVNVSFGFVTVLEFPEKPVMVAVGDDSLIQTEVPQNSRQVVIKPMEESGVTNLFVFTTTERFNYQVVIGLQEKSDYVVDVKQSKVESQGQGTGKDVSLVDLIKMTQNYSVLKELGNVNDRQLTGKRLYQLCDHPKVNVCIVDLFKYKDPHYLIAHITVRNNNYQDITLTEKNTKLYANDEAFVPRYVFFEKNTLKPEEKTNGWLFLKDSYMSLDNHFQVGIGAGDEEYKCR